ncbi:MAG: hypothetical protein WA777_06815 [Rhodanobacter sp.]
MFNASKTVLAGLFAMALSTAAMAAQPQLPSTGLGQAWPNATDVSSSPHYHVYVFQKDGIKYVQVNSLNGTVLGAFATAGDVLLALPMGTNAEPANASTAPFTATRASSTETVYSDKAVQIVATPQSNGTTVKALLMAICTDPVACGLNQVVSPTN